MTYIYDLVIMNRHFTYEASRPYALRGHRKSAYPRIEVAKVRIVNVITRLVMVNGMRDCTNSYANSAKPENNLRDLK